MSSQNISTYSLGKFSDFYFEKENSPTAKLFTTTEDIFIFTVVTYQIVTLH